MPKSIPFVPPAKSRPELCAIQTALDPMCYPPLNSADDIWEPELTFAQRLAGHIKYCTAEAQRSDSEDPTQIIIY